MTTENLNDYDFAPTYAQHIIAVMGSRILNPETRATRPVVVTSTTSIRTYRCAYCRAVIDTESTRWPRTQHSYRAEANHRCDEMLAAFRMGASVMLEIPREAAETAPIGALDFLTATDNPEIIGSVWERYRVYKQQAARARARARSGK